MLASFSILLALAGTLLATPLPELTKRQNYAAQFIIANYCPSEISLYQGGNFDTKIPSGGSVTRFTRNGFFYTDANGGNANGYGTMRAGFYDAGGYFMVKEGNGPLNTGMSITPQQRPTGGYCVPISCETNSCATAFLTPPMGFPAPAGGVPPPPYYRCPVENTTFVINFCPSGTWPPPATWRIHPNYNHPEKCLDVRGGVFANGTPVQIYDCNGTPAQDWVLNRGSTKVKLAGTNFCLDAGSAPANGVGQKIWQCYDNLPAQQWFYTVDDRLAVEGQGQCLDLPQGLLANGGQVQTWQCGDGNVNQIWSI